MLVKMFVCLFGWFGVLFWVVCVSIGWLWYLDFLWVNFVNLGGIKKDVLYFGCGMFLDN